MPRRMSPRAASSDSVFDDAQRRRSDPGDDVELATASILELNADRTGVDSARDASAHARRAMNDTMRAWGVWRSPSELMTNWPSSSLQFESFASRLQWFCSRRRTALASVRTRLEDRRRAGSLRGTVGRPYQRRRPRGEWGITDLARLASGASCSRTKRSASAWRNRARHPRTFCRSPRRPLRRRTTRTNATTRTRTTRRRGTPRVARQVRVVSVVPWIDRIRTLDSIARGTARRRARAASWHERESHHLSVSAAGAHIFLATLPSSAPVADRRSPTLAAGVRQGLTSSAADHLATSASSPRSETGAHATPRARFRESRNRGTFPPCLKTQIPTRTRARRLHSRTRTLTPPPTLSSIPQARTR